ncbi:MAG: hypothetical protein JO267_12080 [Alphaproteobacteria bacterium]|nr:hypothetical protein [Alphaproteobacteria bacterium]
MKLLLSTVVALMLASAVLVQPAEARCWWNGYVMQCWHPHHYGWGWHRHSWHGDWRRHYWRG